MKSFAVLFSFILALCNVSNAARKEIRFSSKYDSKATHPAGQSMPRPFLIYGIYESIKIPNGADCEKVMAEFVTVTKLINIKNDPDSSLNFDFDFSATCDFDSTPDHGYFDIEGYIDALTVKGDATLREYFEGKYFRLGDRNFDLEQPIQTMGVLEVGAGKGFGQISPLGMDLPDRLRAVIAVPLQYHPQYITDLLNLARIDKPHERKEKVLDLLTSVMPDWSREQLEAKLLESNDWANGLSFSISPVLVFPLRILDYHRVSWADFEYCLPRGYKCFNSDPLPNP